VISTLKNIYNLQTFEFHNTGNQSIYNTTTKWNLKKKFHCQNADSFVFQTPPTLANLELAFEGHRWLTHKRLGLDIQRTPEDCSNLDNACSLSSSDRRFTLPIPLNELAANPLMVQNPDY
jgi:hypothetical protein